MKILNEKMYDFLKWVTVILIPAIGVFYYDIANIYSLPYAGEVMQTSNVLTCFLGCVLMIDTVGYNREKK